MTSSKDSLDVKELELLITRIQEGNTSQYSLIVKAFQQPIYRYCYRLLANKQDAEDAVQDILVKAYQSLHQYKRAENFSAWLYRIAYNHCLNLLRKRRVHKQVMRIIRWETQSASPEQELDNRLYNPSLAVALSQLSPEERSMLVMRVFEEQTYAEMSEILKIRPNALIKRMNRIKQKVRKVMKSEEEEIDWREQKLPMNTKI
ncbi:RNA polymerase sigma factor [Paenibacillus fonticola]|uniref:RNA polymerase sigma factor n=1 Tax=Paenibacillus fonticola TaxID=379896 RepID=UPI000377B4BC|nr:RNA polymerase sigma factor [Paenibacillus fonticola]